MASVLSTRALGGQLFQRIVRVDYTDLVAAATTASESLGDALPDGAVLLDCEVDLVTAFADAGAISALAVEVGDSADPNAFFTAYEVLSGASAGRKTLRGVWASISGVIPVAKFTATGANLGDGAVTSLDAGAINIYLTYAHGVSL